MNLTIGRPPPVFEAARRSPQTEILDDGVDAADLKEILCDLARFNSVMQGHRPVIRWLNRATQAIPSDQPLTLLDIGCGYGDLLRAVRQWARQHGRRMRLVGIDLSPQVIEVARSVTDPADDIIYEAADVFDYQPQALDFAVTSLVTHHLSDAMIVRFLRWMESTARRGWLVYDLQRSIVPFHFIALAGTILRLHPVVVYDGRVSVARSLTRNEWRARLAEAGFSPGTVDLRWFMFRFTIGRLK